MTKRRLGAVLAAAFVVGILLFDAHSASSSPGITFKAAKSAGNMGATTLEILKPTGVGSGDFLLAQISVRGGTATMITPPTTTTWTFLRRENNSTTLAQAIYFRVAGSSEPASYTWTFGSSQKASGGIIAYTGVDLSNPINASSGNTGTSTGNNQPVTASSVTTTVSDAMVVGFFGIARSTGLGQPTGMTERYQAQSAMGNAETKTTSAGDDVIQATPGTTGDKTSTASQGAEWVAHLVALRPAAAAARTTSTNVTCDPATVPVLGTTTCTATVTDDDAGTSTHKGTVTFSLVSDDGETGAFTPATGTCMLNPTATGDSNSCSVDYTPATIGDGTHEIGASYTPTDGIHAASSDPTPFQLGVRARTTSTNVTCDPATVPVLGTTTCTATVTDTDAGTSTPQGMVSFSLVADTGESGAFTPVTGTCTLDLTATGNSNSCSVGYTPATIGDGTHEIGASYTPTDGIHAASSDLTPFQLTVRLRTTSTGVSCTPSTIEAGDSTTCTATVTDTDAGTSTPQGTVSFSATGSGNSFLPASCTLDLTATGDSNSCSVNYSSTQAATHTITANYGGSLTHEESTGTTTVTVEPGPPFEVVVDPPTAVNDVDTDHCVTATVRDRFGNPTPGITVVFTVQGSNTASGSRVTGSTGETPTFCYRGVLIGVTDVITAFADFNPENDKQDPGEPFGTATKVWRIPASTALCEVTITQGGWIIASNQDKASFGGNAQVSNAGEPTGQEEYQDHGPIQAMNVRSTRILAVLCSEDLKQATIFGLATIDGSGEFAYRIDVQDLGEPGVGQDTYRMRIGIYDSGQPGTLLGGNVQIHKL